ncbi:hypothetical protein JCM1840_006636 [Sporobolomyces johnsonii]
MQLLDLPPELLLQIVQLSVADPGLDFSARSEALCNYTLVCSALRGLAQRELVRDVRIDTPSQLDSFLAFAHAIQSTTATKKARLRIGTGTLQEPDMATVLQSCPALESLHVIFRTHRPEDLQALYARRPLLSSLTLPDIHFRRMENLVEIQLDCATGWPTTKIYLNPRHFPSLRALSLLDARLFLHPSDNEGVVMLEEALLDHLDVFIVDIEAWLRLPAPLLKKHKDKTLLSSVAATFYSSFNSLRDRLDVFPPHVLVGIPAGPEWTTAPFVHTLRSVDDLLQSHHLPQLQTVYLPPNLREPSKRSTQIANLQLWTTFNGRIEFADEPGANGEPLLSHPFAKRCLAAKAQRADEA